MTELVDDAFNLACMGYLNYSIVFRLTRALIEHSTELLPWKVVLRHLYFIHRHIADTTIYKNVKVNCESSKSLSASLSTGSILIFFIGIYSQFDQTITRELGIDTIATAKKNYRSMGLSPGNFEMSAVDRLGVSDMRNDQVRRPIQLSQYYFAV